jgi:hypothetical protein
VRSLTALLSERSLSHHQQEPVFVGTHTARLTHFGATHILRRAARKAVSTKPSLECMRAIFAAVRHVVSCDGKALVAEHKQTRICFTIFAMRIDALPEDVDALRALVSQLSGARDAAIAESQRLTGQNDKLRHLLKQLQRAQFGRKRCDPVSGSLLRLSCCN